MVTFVFMDKQGCFAVDNVDCVLNKRNGTFEVYFVDGSKEVYEETEFVGMETKN